jgi:hypothetical protein
MGAGISTEPTSRDGLWASVAVWDPECTKNSQYSKDNWHLLAPNLFDDLDDSDMQNITSIMVGKKHTEDREGWVINHDIIRVFEINWDPKERGYNYKSSTRICQDDGSNPEIGGATYPTYRMYRLAVNKAALEDYKNMKSGKSDGSLFKQVSKDLEQYHTVF